VSGPLKKYAFINAKLRARISKILPDELTAQMMRTSSLTETMQLLRDTPFADMVVVYNSTGDLKSAELELLKKEIALYLEFERLIPGEEELLGFIRALTLRYETDNLKQALRLWFDQAVRERNIDTMVGYLYRQRILHSLPLDGIINAPNLETVIELLGGTPYGRILEAQSEQVMAGRSLFPAEIALDHFFYRTLRGQADQLETRDREIVRRMIGVEIDLQNINWLIRFKEFYKLPLEEVLAWSIPEGHALDRKAITDAYGSKEDTLLNLIKKRYSEYAPLLAAQGTGSQSRLVLLERILEQIMLTEVRHILSGYPFTIGIILSYFILKRTEIKTVMTILNAKFYQLPEERIKSVL
jgi:V/A-type H+-transporting ATPase subunit C